MPVDIRRSLRDGCPDCSNGFGLPNAFVTGTSRGASPVGKESGDPFDYEPVHIQQSSLRR